MNLFNVACCVVLCVAVFLGGTYGDKERGDLSPSEDSQELVRRSVTLTSLAATVKQLQDEVNQIITGAKGLPFLRGRDGRDGPPGDNGRDGRDGSLGSPGVRGLMGDAGAKGDTGPTGPQGAQGPAPSSGLQYTRWGKRSCPPGAQLIYTGRVGGEYYGHTGGGSQYVCLPEYPQYMRTTAGVQGYAYMYGTEYQGVGNLFTRGSLLEDHEVPCSVCYVTSRVTQLMIPAQYQCPAGWTREYYGYLMSNHYGHAHSTEFVCVDRDADYVFGTKPDVNGALLFPVEGQCGALPCAPYVQGNELTCALCTK